MERTTVLFSLMLISGCIFSAGGNGADEGPGYEVFTAACANCHGADGDLGLVINDVAAPDLNDRVPASTDEHLISVVEEGYETMRPVIDAADGETADLLAYLRERFGEQE